MRSRPTPPHNISSTTLIAPDQRPVYQLKTTPAVPTNYEEAMERARALKPNLRERVPETEQLRHLLPETWPSSSRTVCTD